MKKSFLIAVFICLYLGLYAQYGKLQPFREGDSTILIMRTPPETLKKLRRSEKKDERNIASTIESVENQLNILRRKYLYNISNDIFISTFLSNIKSLEANGVNVTYYVEEYFIYYPRQEGIKKKSKA